MIDICLEACICAIKSRSVCKISVVRIYQVFKYFAVLLLKGLIKEIVQPKLEFHPFATDRYVDVGCGDTL